MSTATTSRAHRPASGRRSRKASAAERGPSPEEKLVADLIALIEQGTAPWRREWQGHQGVHRNLLTGHAYRGSNPLLLEFAASRLCWASGEVAVRSAALNTGTIL